MALGDRRLYSQHVANLRELELAVSHVARLARSAISSGDPQRSVQSLVRLYAFLIGAWAECRLKKLLFEDNGFSPEERAKVLAEDTQLKQWQTCVDESFRKHHNIRRAE